MRIDIRRSHSVASSFGVPSELWTSGETVGSLGVLVNSWRAVAVVHSRILGGQKESRPTTSWGRTRPGPGCKYDPVVRNACSIMSMMPMTTDC
jgi:hypothetical protein